MKTLKKSEIKVFQWNCRSITTNLAYLKHFLASNQCDVLILQSLNVTSSKLPKLPNYYFPPVHNTGNQCQKVYVTQHGKTGLKTQPLILSNSQKQAPNLQITHFYFSSFFISSMFLHRCKQSILSIFCF